MTRKGKVPAAFMAVARSTAMAISRLHCGSPIDLAWWTST